MTLKRVLTSAILLFVFLGVSQAQQPATPAETPAHKYFTDVELVNQNGEKMRFYSDLIQGKVVIINSFFATCQGSCLPLNQNLAKVQEALGDAASAARSQPYYLDVTHPEANKGGVVAWFSRRLGVPEGEIATIGDQPNDVLMFRRSGFAIAMGNASVEVQAQADAVTASYDDEGFARAVERFFLDGAAAP